MDETRIGSVATSAAAIGGRDPSAVLPARTRSGRELFVCAFERDPSEPDSYDWLMLDDAGQVVHDTAVVRETAELIAMCETAEEASAALAAPEADDALRRALDLAEEAGDDRAALACRAMREAIAPLAAAEPEIRVARGAYLDEVAQIANLVGDRFDFLKETAYELSAQLSGRPGEPGEELAEAAWNAVRILARDGPPDRFREAVEGGMGAASAFADDLVSNYLEDLE
jgi:hypothetical protein